MSLEQELIRGAYRAHAKDPYNLVGQAKKRAGEQLTKSVESVVEAFGAKGKKEKEETKGYEDNWQENQKEFIDNQGLGKTGWGQATDLAEELKAVHDACTSGQEGNRCRQESIIDLKNMAQKYADQKDSLQSVMDTQDKIKAGKIDLSEAQSPDAKKILAGLNDKNSANRMKNDDEIASIKEQLKTAKPEDKEALNKQIEELTDSNERVVGWDIPGTDKDGNPFGFMTADDLNNANLLPVKASDVTAAYGTRIEDQNLKYAKFKKGEKGGAGFDMNESKHAYAKTITEDNIASVYADTVLETDQPLKEHLKDHPIFTDKYSGTRLTYDSLGLPASLDTDGDESIDADEFAVLVDEDKATIINALSSPDDDNFNFKLSKDVASEWMALNEEKEANKTLYGDEYYPKPSGEDGVWMPADLTIPDYKGEGDKWFSTPEEYQAALKHDKSTQRDGEDDQAFEDRGGIKGAGAGRSKVYKEIYGKSVDIQESIEGESVEDIIAKL